MFTLFKKHTVALVFLAVLLTATFGVKQSWAPGPGLGALVEEADGDPAGFAYKIKFPNGSLSLSGSIATYTGGGSIGADLLPDTDNTYDIGSSSLEWKDLYVDGVAHLDGLTFDTVEKSSDAITLTADECSGTLITNRGWDGNDDQTFTLPEADDSTSAGCAFKFLAVVASGGTADTYFDTEGSTTNVYLDGTAIGDGERVWTQEIAVGEGIVCHAATTDGSTYDWFCDTCNGFWEDKGS